jgi:hypothetical protein
MCLCPRLAAQRQLAYSPVHRKTQLDGARHGQVGTARLTGNPQNCVTALEQAVSDWVLVGPEDLIVSIASAGGMDDR